MNDSDLNEQILEAASDLQSGLKTGAGQKTLELIKLGLLVEKNSKLFLDGFIDLNAAAPGRAEIEEVIEILSRKS